MSLIETLSADEHEALANSFGIDAELWEVAGESYIVTISEIDSSYEEPFLLKRSESGRLEIHDGDGFDWIEFDRLREEKS